MKKETTLLLLCALFLLADAVCLRQTLIFGQILAKFSFGTIVSIEIFTALLILSFGFLVARKMLGNPIKRRPRSGIFPPLRRLILSVLTLKFARR